MNVDRLEAFAEELMSREHPQTNGCLFRQGANVYGYRNGKCCLGVAANLAIEEGWVNGEWGESDASGRTLYLSEEGGGDYDYLPPEVIEAYGFDHEEGWSIALPQGDYTLAGLNDDLGWNFRKIGQAILDVIEGRVETKERA